jgi:iron complex outermembrane receptor protein
MLRTGLFLLFIALSSFHALAQSCELSLSGVVSDAHDGTPLSFAIVRIQELNKSVLTDSLGRYRFTELCEGLYHVECNHVGCEPVHALVRLNRNLVLDLKPEHHIHEINEAVISGVRLTDRMLSEREMIGRQEIEMSQGLALGDILKTMNGVQTLQTGNSIVKPMIRGMQGNRIVIYNHGLRQEAQQWGNEHAPEIDPMTAGSLTVIKGAGATRYGSDAIGGVIIADPLPLPDSAGIDGNFQLSGASNGRMGSGSAMIQGRWKKIPLLALRVQGTLKRSGNVHSPDYFLANTGSSERNFSWTAAYGKRSIGTEIYYSQFNSDIGIFSAAHIGNLGDLRRAFESEVPLVTDGFRYEIDRPRQEIVHELFRSKSWWFTPRHGKWMLTYGRQYNLRREYDRHLPLNDSLAGLNRPSLQFEITTHSMELMQEHRIGNSITGSIGMSGLFQFNTYEGRFFIPNFRKWNTGLFWLEKWTSSSGNTEIETGLRYDFTSQQIFKWEGSELIEPLYQYRGWSGNVGINRRISKSFEMSLSTGYSWRPPHVSEMYSDGIHHGTASFEKGDPALKPESVWGSTLSGEWKTKRIRFISEIYYNHFYNMIYLNPELPARLTIRGAFPSFSYREAEARHYGTGLEFHYELFSFMSIEMRASALRAKVLNSGYFLPLMPADRSEIALHLFSDKGSLHEKTFSLRLMRVNKQWRADPLSDYIPPPDAYFLVGLESGIRFHIGTQPVRAGLEVRNLFNTVYRDYLDRLRYFTNGTGTNILLRINVPLGNSTQPTTIK